MIRTLHALGLLMIASGCMAVPRPYDRKEVFVEPFREAEYELARLSRVVPYPLDPEVQPRSFSFARPLDGALERTEKTRLLIAGAKSDPEEPDARDPNEPPIDPQSLEKPPTSLILPERIDVREGSACYVGHGAFLDDEGGGIIHHLTILVVNCERARITIPLASFLVRAERSRDDKGKSEALTFLAAATERGIKIPELMVVPAGERRTAHFFYIERLKVSPILQLSWTAVVEDPRGGVAREVPLRGELVRRYVCDRAPLTALEQRVGRGQTDFPAPTGSRDDWVDPGLSAVPGVGR